MDNPFDNAEGKAAIKRRLPDGTPDDTIQDYIEDAWARAISIAPCIALDSFPPSDKPEKEDLLKAILRSIILRWNEASAGGVAGKTQMAGPYQQALQFDARPKRGLTLINAEIVDLQRLCLKKGRPFTFDTMPDDFKVTTPLHGVVVNGDENLNGPPGEWSPDAPEVDI